MIEVNITGVNRLKFDGCMPTTSGWYKSSSNGRYVRMTSEEAELFVWKTFVKPVQVVEGTQ